MRWLVIIAEWSVLLPLWRRLIKDPLWRVPAATCTGVIFFVGGVAALIVALWLLFPGDDVGKADRANDELMASLPVYPSATLVEKYRFDDYRRVPGIPFNPLRNFRTLTFTYAAPSTATEDDVLRFWREEMSVRGWEADEGDFGGPYSFWGDGSYIYVTLLGFGYPDSLPHVDATPVQDPPAPNAFFFQISVARRL